MATANLKENHIKWPNGTYLFTVNGREFSEDDFFKSFIPSFCLTVYKNQGSEVNSDYNIFDINRMDTKRFYTSLSKTTKFEYTRLDENLLLKSYYQNWN